MNSISRRDMLAATAAGGLLTAATVASAQTAEPIPQPQRPGHGGTDPGPRNVVRDRQNPDLLVPPSTDHGTLPNLRFSFADAHMRQETGGWTRQITVRELGISKNIAGVNMRLNAGGVRELHWHKAAEWAYMLYGSARITAIDAQGRNFVDDVGVGDLWYFPSGIPHSIQGLGPDGAEFLLVFDDGDFDEDNTFLISDWFKHTPNEVLGKNFGVPATLFGHTPDPSELYIFPAAGSGPAQRRTVGGATAVPQELQPPDAGAGADQDERRNGADHRFQHVPGFYDNRGGTRRGRSRRHARVALAPQHRRMAILDRRPGTHGRVRCIRSGPHFRFSSRRRRLCARSRWATMSRTSARRPCASWKSSRAATSPTCRSTSGWL